MTDIGTTTQWIWSDFDCFVIGAIHAGVLLQGEVVEKVLKVIEAYLVQLDRSKSARKVIAASRDGRGRPDLQGRLERTDCLEYLVS